MFAFLLIRKETRREKILFIPFQYFWYFISASYENFVKSRNSESQNFVKGSPYRETDFILLRVWRHEMTIIDKSLDVPLVKLITVSNGSHRISTIFLSIRVTRLFLLVPRKETANEIFA